MQPDAHTLDDLAVVLAELDLLGITDLPVLSLWEPWASAMRWGVKRAETRSWRPTTNELAPGSWFVIAATANRRPFRDVVRGAVAGDEHARWMLSDLERVGVELHTAPFGHALTLVRFVDAVPTSKVVWRPGFHAGWDVPPETPHLVSITVQEQRWGDYSPNRYAWLTDSAVPLPAPVPFKGGQKLTRTISVAALAEVA